MTTSNKHFSATHAVEAPQTTKGEASNAVTSILSPVVTRFYTEFVQRLRDPHHRTATNSATLPPPREQAKPAGTTPHAETNGVTWDAKDEDDGSQDEESADLRRLSFAQLEALQPLLWQWLLLLLCTPDAAQPNTTDEAPTLYVEPKVQQQIQHERQRTPQQVEMLFHSGLSSLIPSITTVAGMRVPASDFIAPWRDELEALSMCESAPSTRASSALKCETSLTCALNCLSRGGPLFSAWCALCFVCMKAARAGGTASHRSSNGEIDARAALAALRGAWDASASRLRETCGRHRDRHTSSDAFGTPLLDLESVQQFWYDVFKHSSEHVIERAQNVENAPAEELQPPHPLFCVWVTQWYVECCRVAAHGRDDGFDVEAIPLPLLTRVTHHCCQRLEEEIDAAAEGAEEKDPTETISRCAEPQPSLPQETPPSTSLPSAMAVSSRVMGTESFADHPGKPHDVASTPASLRIATLTGLALQTPCAAATCRAPTTRNSTAATGGAGVRATARVSTTRRRRQKRRRQGQSRTDSSCDDDSTDEEEEMDGHESDGEGDLHRGEWQHTSHAHSGMRRTALQRFLAEREERYAVPVAAGVLTSYTLTPALAGQGGASRREGNAVGAQARAEERCGPTSRAGTNSDVEDTVFSFVNVQREVYIRSGEVQWWTLGDSQQHRRLLTDKRA